MMKNKKLWIYTFLLVMLGCYDDPVEDLRNDASAEGTLTIEAAHELYREYMSRRPVSRSLDDGGVRSRLDPGMITAHWESATVSNNGVNSYVAVPFHATRAYYAKSVRNEKYVSVLQKVVVVQEDSTLRNDVYVMSLIPEGEFAKKPKYELAVLSEGGTVPKDYSGLLLYTLPDGGLPIYTARLESGRVVEDVYIFDKSRPVEENFDRLNGMLAGYSLRSYGVASPNSLPEYSGGTDPDPNEGINPGKGSGDVPNNPGDDDWIFEPDGSVIGKDGNEYWYFTDERGDTYWLVDSDGDGEPDQVLLPGVTPDTGGGWDGVGGFNPGGGNIGWGGQDTGESPETPEIKRSRRNPDFPAVRPKTEETDCSEKHKQIKQYAKEVLDRLFNAPAGTDPRYTSLPTYSDFLAAVESDPRIEHSYTISSTGGGKYMSYSPIQHGDSTHVKVFGDNLSVVAEIHSHPNNTPPSHDDIMSVARFGGKANSMYEGLYVYTNDRIYGLIVTDRQKASAFYNRYGDKAVGENNLFVEKTLERDWRTAMSHYRGLKGEFTNWYQALAYLLAKYETGLALVYFDKGENAGYQAVGVNSVRDSNGFYRPTKCR